MCKLLIRGVCWVFFLEIHKILFPLLSVCCKVGLLEQQHTAQLFVVFVLSVPPASRIC